MSVWNKLLTATVAAAVAAVGVLGASPAAASSIDGQVLAERVFASADPDAAFNSLDQASQAAVTEWVTPVRIEETSDQAESEQVARQTRAAGCYTYTARSSFSNAGGAQIGSMWTTGKVCYNGATVTSASFVDGSGSTSFLGWSYRGRVAAKAAVAGNAGYAYGQYKFQLNLGGVVVQEPTYCARVVGTSVAAHGDTACGIGG